jgi:hypothetical protein
MNMVGDPVGTSGASGAKPRHTGYWSHAGIGVRPVRVVGIRKLGRIQDRGSRDPAFRKRT